MKAEFFGYKHWSGGRLQIFPDEGLALGLASLFGKASQAPDCQGRGECTDYGRLVRGRQADETGERLAIWGARVHSKSDVL